MPPQPQELVKFPTRIFVEALEACGCEIYLLEQFPDGMTRWGDGNEIHPSFSGSSALADTTEDGKISFTDIRAILNKLNRAGHYGRIQDQIQRRLQEPGANG
jgi:hypothetical protein